MSEAGASTSAVKLEGRKNARRLGVGEADLVTVEELALLACELPSREESSSANEADVFVLCKLPPCELIFSAGMAAGDVLAFMASLLPTPEATSSTGKKNGFAFCDLPPRKAESRAKRGGDGFALHELPDGEETSSVAKVAVDGFGLLAGELPETLEAAAMELAAARSRALPREVNRALAAGVSRAQSTPAISAPGARTGATMFSRRQAPGHESNLPSPPRHWGDPSCMLTSEAVGLGASMDVHAALRFIQ